jgi:hypothetical protein
LALWSILHFYFRNNHRDSGPPNNSNMKYAAAEDVVASFLIPSYQQFKASRITKLSTQSGSYCRPTRGQLPNTWGVEHWETLTSLFLMQIRHHCTNRRQCTNNLYQPNSPKAHTGSFGSGNGGTAQRSQTLLGGRRPHLSHVQHGATSANKNHHCF